MISWIKNHNAQYVGDHPHLVDIKKICASIKAFKLKHIYREVNNVVDLETKFICDGNYRILYGTSFIAYHVSLNTHLKE